MRFQNGENNMLQKYFVKSILQNVCFAGVVVTIRKNTKIHLLKIFFVKLFLQFDKLGFYKEIEPTRDFYGKSTFFPSNQRSVNKDVDFTEKF